MKRYYLCLILVILIISGCGGGGGGGDSGSTPPPPPKTWTVFIYGHADHSLTYSLAADMSEMSQASLGAHMNVIVAADWDSSKTIGGNGGVSTWEPGTNGSGYPTGVEWYKMSGGGLAPTKFSTEVEANLDSTTYLQDATDFAFQNYPADRYGIILWDHGGSWEGGFGGDSQNGTVSGTGMTASGAATAIANALTARGITGTRPLEFIAFDTCLMACPEVIQPFKDLAKTYIACAEIDFGDGWDYTNTLGYISANSTAAATAIAAQEVSFWNSHHSSPTDIVAKSHMAIDLSQWDAFASSMSQVVTSINASPSMTALDWGVRQFTSAPGYYFDADQARSQPNLRDAGQLLTKLATVTSDTNVASKASSARSALIAMRLGLSQGVIRSINDQSGLHIECAIAKKYTDDPSRLSLYATNAASWNAASSWSSLLSTVQTFDDGTQPSIAVTSTGGGASVAVEFTTADADIGEAAVWVTRTNPDSSIDDFGLVGVDIIDPGTYQFDWNLKIPTLDNGITTSFARAERVIIGDGVDNSLFGISCSYTVGVDTINGFVIFGSNDSYSTLFMEIDAIGGVKVLPLYPGGIITPKIDRYTGGPTPTSISMTALTIPSNRQLGVGDYSAPTGTYKLLVTGMDVWGNEASVLTVPYAITKR